MSELRSYLVYPVNHQDWGTVINHITAEKAKSVYWRDAEDSFRYLDIRARLHGLPHTSDQFKSMCEYRKIPFAYCGMKVTIGGEEGYIVGHNESANLNVLFLQGKYKGQTLSCHPHSEVVYYDKDGNIVNFIC